MQTVLLLPIALAMMSLPFNSKSCNLSKIERGDHVTWHEVQNDANNPKIKVIRYADDVIITGNSEQTLIKCKHLMEEYIKERGLQLNQDKTKISNIRNGIDFLGFNIIKKQ